MKRMNFWKTLFFSVLAVTAFTGCSNDDTDDGNGMPSITVNGDSTAKDAVTFSGGDLTFSIVSTGDWTLAFDDSSTSSWCHPALTSGSAGTTSLTITVDAWEDATDEDERSASLTLTATGILSGVGTVSAKAYITVMQNSSATTQFTTNVKSIRNSLSFDGSTISSSTVVTGIIVSDYAGENINNHQIMITDNTTESGAGLLVRFAGYVGNTGSDYNLPAGAVVSFDLQGAVAQLYNSVQYQVDFSSSSDPSFTILDSGDNMPDPITIADVADLADYQSQYVQIYSQPIESIRGEAYYNVTSGYANHTFQTPDGSTFVLAFMSYTSEWASAVTIPSNAGYMKGCVTFNGTSPTLSPRNASDLADMTEPLFESQAKTVTISDITSTGEYSVENVQVAATCTSGFVIQDETGAFFVYGVADGSSIPAVGNVVNISGTVTTYGNNYQFASPTVEVVDDGTDYEAPTPTEITADNIADIATGKPQYVKLTGELNKSGNYYNFNFLFTTTYTGSLCYPDSDWADPFIGMTIDVVGWFVYTNYSYVYVVADTIEENTSVASGSFTTTPTAFAATDPQPQTLSFTASEAAGTVSFQISGTDADKFTYSDVTSSSVTVSAVGDNESESAYTATLQMLAEDGTTVLAEVSLTQVAPLPEGATQVTFDFSTMGFENSEEVPSVSSDPILITFGLGSNTNGNSAKYYTTGSGVRTYVGNTITISGATILQVDFTFSGSSYNLISADNYVANEAEGTWTGESSEVVFNSTGTTRIQKIVVTYK